MYSKILVPLDGSKTAEKVLPYARHLAGKFKIPVELLAVLDIAEMATHVSAEKARHLDTMIEDGMRASTTYLRGIATTFPEGNVTCTVEKDRAEEAIIGKAGADGGTLIAMATHGRSGMDRFLLGSVAEKVLRGSANPLVLVRAKEEAKTSGEAPFEIDHRAAGRIGARRERDSAGRDHGQASSTSKWCSSAPTICRTTLTAATTRYMVNYDELIDSVRDEAKEYLDKQVAEVKKLGVAKGVGAQQRR